MVSAGMVSARVVGVGVVSAGVVTAGVMGPGVVGAGVVSAGMVCAGVHCGFAYPSSRGSYPSSVAPTVLPGSLTLLPYRSSLILNNECWG